jgi:MtN3 and saliva related transmembrane protein
MHDRRECREYTHSNVDLGTERAARVLPSPSIMVDAIGWFSSVVLLATILNQVHRQWVNAADQTASMWLFSGQATASFGFTAYSWLLNNWVFTATNAMLLLSAIAGFWISSRQKHRTQKGHSGTGLAAGRELQ